jgi:hypothetical protein
MALVVGQSGRFAKLLRAHVRVHRKDAQAPETAPFDWPRDPPVTPDESRLLDAVARSL